MTATTRLARTQIHGRKLPFVVSLVPIVGRSLRSIPREPEAIAPALIVPIFFYAVAIGSFELITASTPGFDIKEFQLPVAIIFAVTGVSRASTLVTDIQTGYFDRLLATPTNRLALLLGLMIADLMLVICLGVPVVALGHIVGVRFATGILGIIAFLVIGGLWGLAFTGFPYAIALRTGSPAAVGSSFLLFFPFAFLTTVYLPMDALTGWMQAIARYNPITYILAGLRSLITDGWDIVALGQAFVAIGAVMLVSMSLALLTLRGRVSRG